MKENINKYETVEEVLSDLRQIWENCRLFNAEGSDISATANMMDMELEGLVEVRASLQNFYTNFIILFFILIISNFIDKSFCLASLTVISMKIVVFLIFIFLSITVVTSDGGVEVYLFLSILLCYLKLIASTTSQK